jgi:thymidylate kinase
MTIVVDGNDGTGKSTLAVELDKMGYAVKDRGVPTKMTDDPSLSGVPDEVYLILDCDPGLCQERLVRAGKDLTERYHTAADLIHYRQRFLDVAAQLPHCRVIDASGDLAEVLRQAVKALGELDL